MSGNARDFLAQLPNLGGTPGAWSRGGEPNLNLVFARATLADPGSFATIGDVTKRAAELRDRQPDL